MIHRIEVLGTAGCPHLPETSARVRRVVERLGVKAEIHEITVADLDQAVLLDFPGSPTVRVNGEDITRETLQPALACRLYEGDGAPPEWLLEAALVRASGPAHILFLCVANSARSQMAEGIARSLAPSAVAISSAGSEPTRVRPEALRALAEIGIDASRQRSKGVDDVEGRVDTVITLCAEEVCPVWLGEARRFHWALPDPAATEGSADDRLNAFRQVRDQLVRRIQALF